MPRKSDRPYKGKAISWESFVSNRLPLLNLPEDIKDALQTGKIAYTKATVIARLKEQPERQELLEAAIAEVTSRALRGKTRSGYNNHSS